MKNPFNTPTAFCIFALLQIIILFCFDWILKHLVVVSAVNSDECLMTRMQEMSLDYHFTVEQEVGSSTHAFFGFNGKYSLFFAYLHCFERSFHLEHH